MTPNELADLLSPQVREAAERAKSDILSKLTPVKRIIVKSVWGMAMQDGVPIMNRIIIEFLIAKYREDIEPLVGNIVDVILKSMEDENISDPRLKLLQEIMNTLKTPTSQFLPAVQKTLDPNQPRIVMDYSHDG